MNSELFDIRIELHRDDDAPLVNDVRLGSDREREIIELLRRVQEVSATWDGRFALRGAVISTHWNFYGCSGNVQGELKFVVNENFISLAKLHSCITGAPSGRPF